VTAINYSAIAHPHILQHTLSLPGCCVFTSRSLVTSYITVEILQLLRSSPFHSVPYWTDCCYPSCLPYNSSARPCSFSYANRFRENVFAEPLRFSGRPFLLIRNLLSSNGRRSVMFRGHSLVTNVLKPFSINGCFSGFTVLTLSICATIYVGLCEPHASHKTVSGCVSPYISILLICCDIWVWVPIEFRWSSFSLVSVVIFSEGYVVRPPTLIS
jgi:hypothetical protein